MSEKKVRIGCAAAFWGDTETAAAQLVRRGEIDYLMFDYLAEITMSILVRARAKDPGFGYATDFVAVIMAPLLKEIAERGIRVVSNAGGINPLACRDALLEAARAAGVELHVAVVVGDDLMPKVESLRAAGVTEMTTGAPMPERLMSMNAYLGARPIAEALAGGADVVITGRAVDSALALGPLMHEFGWGDDDHDLLAAGSLVGHVLECGAQATGGNFTDWRLVEGWDEMGFPVAECAADGDFTLSKPEGTGGLVTPATVGEQMLYEIGDPGAYILPDVVCDFRAVEMRRAGPDRVAVKGARGRPPTDSYKVSATYMDGFRATAALMIGGIEAAAKARKVADSIIGRTRRLFRERNLGDYDEVSLEVLGAEDSYGPHARAAATREVVMKLAVRHRDAAALKIFAREVAPVGTGAAPGITGFFGGRPRPVPVVRLFSCLVAKDRVEVAVRTDDTERRLDLPTGGGFVPEAPADAVLEEPALPQGPRESVPLVALAWGRSGDKGDSANIGVIARRPEYLPLLRAALTAEAVAEWFRHLADGPVRRYELPGIHAFNFVLERALGGGGMASLRMDPQGKAYAQMLLDFPVEVPAAWAAEIRAREGLTPAA